MASFRNWSPYLLLPAAGLLIGWATAPKDRAEDGKTGDTTTQEARLSPRMRNARASTPPMTPDQLLAEARRLVETPNKSRRTTLDETIADWTDEEVIAALELAAKEPDLLLEQDSFAGDLMRAFSKRNPQTAMKWALDQPLLVKRKFAGLVLSALLPTRAEEAYALARTHPDIFEGKVPTNVVRALVTSSAQQGAEVFVASLKDLMADGSAPFMEFPKEVPEGFDFAAAMDSPDFKPLVSQKLKSSMLSAWMAEDRDAAFQWVLENDGARKLDQLRDSRWSYAELKGHVRWMAEKVEAMPEEQWRDVVLSSRISFNNTQGHANLWLESLRDPTKKEAFRDAAAGGIFYGHQNSVEVGLKALDGLPDAPARIDRLEALSQSFSGIRIPPNADAEKLLREKLEQWGADPQRTETIIGNVHKGRPQTQQ